MILFFSACRARTAVVGLAFGLLGVLPGPVRANDLDDGRREFQAAYALASAAVPAGPGEAPAFATENATDSEVLRRYPLYPYLLSARLQRRLQDPAIAPEVELFFANFGDQPVARSLRRSWLMQLALRKDWEPYLAAYREDVDDTAAARCNALAARAALGRTEGLAETAAATYLSPTSLPSSCDPMIDWLRSTGRLTPALVEQRARLALGAGEAGLARVLARALPSGRAAPIEQWADLIQRPRTAIDGLIAQPTRAVESGALFDGWSRFARADADAAAERFPAFIQARGLDARAASPFAIAVALPLSWSRSPRSLEFFALAQPEDFDDRAHEWHARAALWAGDWPQVRRAIDAMPEALRSQNRWRYWAARSAEQLGDREAARNGYAAVIPTDNWYAVLAAARTGQRFAPTLQPIRPDDAELAKIAADPGLVRTRELLLNEMTNEANLEWRVAVDALAADAQVQAVRLASGWGWHLQAIATAARQGIFNDYVLLYPRPYDPEVRRAADLTRLPDSLIYAVMRQESLYRADAASSAGAVGLMQLLPTTARVTAHKVGLKAPSRAELVNPAVNVPLGAAFLKSLLDRADGQSSLAVAGYNAGPAAARRWLPEAPMDTDIWVENIPYNETRTYVQRTHWHALVFAWLDDRKPREVSNWLGTVRRPAVDAALE